MGSSSGDLPGTGSATEIRATYSYFKAVDFYNKKQFSLALESIKESIRLDSANANYNKCKLDIEKKLRD